MMRFTRKLISWYQPVCQLTKFEQADKRWIVVYHPKDQNLECKCMEFQSSDILCCHLFCVMKSLHLYEIPDSLLIEDGVKMQK